jgi:hypothetical protein
MTELFNLIFSMPTYIYQIFYDLRSQYILDGGFIPLNNKNNERPDWREYWPIKNFLSNNLLDEDSLYGFFSPKFKEKTSLTSDNVKEFINVNSGHDVFLFCPYFDQAAYFKSVFEHMFEAHPSSNKIDIINSLIEKIGYAVNLNELVMDSRHTIFSNFIVAKPKFWRLWLALNEKIFNEAEDAKSTFYSYLNTEANYHIDSKVQNKVFIMERIASLILLLEPDFKVCAYNQIHMPIAHYGFKDSALDLAQLNAFKMAYGLTHHSEYINLFLSYRDMLAKVVHGNNAHEVS